MSVLFQNEVKNVKLLLLTSIKMKFKNRSTRQQDFKNFNNRLVLFLLP